MGWFSPKIHYICLKKIEKVFIEPGIFAANAGPRLVKYSQKPSALVDGSLISQSTDLNIVSIRLFLMFRLLMTSFNICQVYFDLDLYSSGNNEI